MPLAVAGTENTLPKHSLVFRPTSASVTVLPAVPVAGLTAEDAPRLAELGIYVRAFAYPVVPMGRSRLRVQLSAAHTLKDMDRAAEAFSAARAA